MEFSTDPDKLKQWVPLMMEGRDPKQTIAATWTPVGTDVEWGEITRQYVAALKAQPKFDLRLSTEVETIERNKDGGWRVTSKNLKDGTRQTVDAKFVFIGAGGGALHLLQKSGIPEGEEYGGFPWAARSWSTRTRTWRPATSPRPTARPRSARPDVGPAPRHARAGREAGDPVRTLRDLFDQVPEGGILFRPAGLDHHSNVWPMVRVGVDQYPLIEYLAGQVMLSDEDRYQALREYFPNAKEG